MPTGKEHIAGRPSVHNEVHVLEEHAHSLSQVYPTLANGVTVTGAAGAWTLGNFVEIIPANTFGIDFDVHWINIEASSADDIYELVLYAGTDEIGRVRFTISRTAGARVLLPPVYFQCRVQAKNSQIQAKVANAGGGSETITISLHVHEY